MSAKLVAYEYVPSGFEMVIDIRKFERPLEIWNLWFNIEHDPEAWDSEVKRINQMQDKLDELTVDQRLIRAQMAEFCRRHPPFPKSIDILCEEIGSGRFSKPVKMGCEGRGLLDSFGYHDLQNLNEQRKEILMGYARSFEKWLGQGLPEKPTESKVFGFIGQRTSAKKAFVEKLNSVIGSKEPPSIMSLRKLSENECMKTHNKLPFFSCFRPACWPEGMIWGGRVCCYFMFVDAGLLCAGTCGEKRSMFNEFIRFIEENILAYSIAVNSWLKEEPLKPVTSLITPRYIAKDNALEIAERVHSFLGEKDEAKTWLTACLLKTVKDNKGWHKPTELIDDFPEATSWLSALANLKSYF